MPTPDQSMLEQAKEIICKAGAAFADALESTGIKSGDVEAIEGIERIWREKEAKRSLEKADTMMRRSIHGISITPDVP